jgi:putative heme-binding domain-containing protein
MHYLYVLRNARNGWTIDSRRTFFAGLAQGKHYAGGAGMDGFLKKIRDEAVATLTNAEREQLGSLIEDTSQTREVVATKPRSLVRKWTVEQLLSPESDQHPRDRARGAEVFATASCIHCHRFGARGTPIGPDLTSVSRRFSRRDLLSSIIEPSSVIAEDYRSLQIVTSDGKSYVGQVALGGDFRSPTLRLSTNPMQPFSTVEIPKTKIESQTFSNVSWMPEGLCDTFTKDEILDLIVYIESAP